jgi:hypothetical protein
MKFCYVDESGGREEGDVFVMCGLLVDVHRLRSKTEEFDEVLQELFARHPGHPAELKTKTFMRGNGGWNAIPGAERRELLIRVCDLATTKGDKIYGIAMSFAAFDQRIAGNQGPLPFGNSYWVCGGMFVSCLLQKKMQAVEGKKGITALVMDDNKVEMPRLSDALFDADAWYDGLYQCQERKKGELVWRDRTEDDRFDQIINTGFSVKSQHSSLVQVSDAISWVFRRSIELETANEAFEGEKAFYAELCERLHEDRITLGRTPGCAAKTFYEAVCHPEWKL